jgi:hypothetical protein
MKQVQQERLELARSARSLSGSSSWATTWLQDGTHESSDSLGCDRLDAEHNTRVGHFDAPLSNEQAGLRRARRTGLLPDLRGTQLLRSSDAPLVRRGAVVRMPDDL